MPIEPIGMLRLFGTLAMLFIGSKAHIQDCGKGTSKFQLTKLSLSPDPPIRGETLNMEVVFDNPDQEISDGTATTTLSLNYIPFQPTAEPLCQSTICPLLYGSNDRSTHSVWPETVSGAVSSKIVWKDSDENLLLCIQIQTKVASYKNLRVYYNETHADLITRVLHLDAPVAYNAFGPPNSLALVLWTNQTHLPFNF